jgi:hypothetical protein
MPGNGAYLIGILPRPFVLGAGRGVTVVSAILRNPLAALQAAYMHLSQGIT